MRRHEEDGFPSASTASKGRPFANLIPHPPPTSHAAKILPTGSNSSELPNISKNSNSSHSNNSSASSSRMTNHGNDDEIDNNNNNNNNKNETDENLNFNSNNLALLYSNSDMESKKKILKLKALNDADKALINELRVRITDLLKEIDKKTLTIQSLQRNYENLSALTKGDREEIIRLNALLTEYQKGLEQLTVVQNQLSESHKEIQLKSENISALQKEVNEIKLILAENDKYINSLIESNTMVGAELASVNMALVEINSELKESKIRESTALERIEALTSLRAQDVNHKVTMTQLNQNNADLKAKTTKLEEQVTELREKRESEKLNYQTSMGEYQKQLDSRAKDIKTLQDSVNDYKEAERTTSVEIQRLASTVEASEKKAANSKIEIKKLEQQLTEKENNIAKLTVSVKEIQQKLNANDTRSQTDKEIEEKQYSQLEVALLEYKNKNKQLEEECHNLKIQLEIANNEKSEATKTLELERSEKFEERIISLIEREQEFQKTTAKLLSAMEAMETDITCMNCLHVLNNPQTLICSHTFCANCIEEMKVEASSSASKNNGAVMIACNECGPIDGSKMFANKVLEKLIIRHEFLQQSVQGLAELAKRHKQALAEQH